MSPILFAGHIPANFLMILGRSTLLLLVGRKICDIAEVFVGYAIVVRGFCCVVKIDREALRHDGFWYQLSE